MTDDDWLELVEHFENQLNRIEEKIDLLRADVVATKIDLSDLSSIKRDVSDIQEDIEDIKFRLDQAGEEDTAADFENLESGGSDLKPWEPEPGTAKSEKS